jgi:hypothetical protein
MAETADTTSPDPGTPAPGSPAPADGAPTGRVPRWAQRLVVAVLLLGAAAGLVLTVRAASTGDDSTSGSLPESVDRLIPPSGTEILRQAPVGIDLAAGYDAELVINGVELPEGTDGLSKDLGTGLVQYVPAPGRPVEQLEAERNCVVALVWRQAEGRGSAEPVSWCFSAS